MLKRLLRTALAIFIVVFTVSFCASPRSRHDVNVLSRSPDAASVALLHAANATQPPVDGRDHEYARIPLEYGTWVNGNQAMTCDTTFFVIVRDAQGNELNRAGPYLIWDNYIGFRYSASVTVNSDNSVEFKPADRNLCVF